MPDLSRKRERERLPVRREPHWQRLAKYCYVGFRRGADTWVARYKKQPKALLTVQSDDYDGAVRAAFAWFTQMSASAVRTVKRSTVKAALETYLADLRRHGRPDAAKGAEWRFKKFVHKDALGDLELEAATRDDFLEWRDRIRPGRANRTVNRQVRSVRAALNRALELGHVGNPAAWKLKPLQDDVEDGGETAIFLDATQRHSLIAGAEPAAGDFLRGMELTGARPFELSAARVGDFDGETLRLAHRKGRPPKLRVRHVVLGKDGVEFFKRQATNKLPSAHLFTEDGAQPWRRHMWARKVRAAIAAHNKEAKGKARIPAAASAYSFRHARISELLQIHGVDPLTVAAQTGTSIAMIEKAYLRFIPSAMREKLAAVKEMT